MRIRLLFRAAVIWVGAALLPTIGLAQGPAAFPIRPITIVVPLAPGGGTEQETRLYAQKILETEGYTLLIDNRPGAAGTVGTAFVARAAPDGYTLLQVIADHTITPASYPDLPYDPVKDFAPISAFSASPQVLLVNSKVPAKTVPEFVTWVKAQPNKIAYGGGGGPGSASNLIMSIFLKRAGLEMTNVSYRGTAPALTDLIAGHIPTTFVPLAEASAQSNNPNVRMLAVSSGKRSQHLKDVPSISEAYPGYNAVSWTGMLAPANTPKQIVDRLGDEMVKAARDPKFLEQMALHGVDPIAEGPEKFAAMIAAEIPIWGEAVKNAGGERPQ